MVVDVNRQRAVGPKKRRVVSVAGIDDDMRDPKFDLSDLTCYGCIIWSSKICKCIPSINIFIYDTDPKIWDTTTLLMNFKRGENSTLDAASNKIFIFGGCPSDDARAWGELYDPAAPSMSCQCSPSIPGTKIFNSKKIDKVQKQRPSYQAPSVEQQGGSLRIFYFGILMGPFSRMSYSTVKLF